MICSNEERLLMQDTLKEHRCSMFGAETKIPENVLFKLVKSTANKPTNREMSVDKWT